MTIYSGFSSGEELFSNWTLMKINYLSMSKSRRSLFPYEAPCVKKIEPLESMSLLVAFSLETDFDDFTEGEEL